ncbi:hypothetical protein [Streptomyces sp. SCA2-2]|uniref:hypothetical protein n=1 Tax=Streptomyces sp. SCA2-2 TaxID=1563677 RepID=UPI00102014EC|nr:hypothetical protein [Streptomyces sp. SCA2-2]
MLIGFTAAPAAAANAGVELPYDRGDMTFIDDGDVFKVCDTKPDVHGVTGTLPGGEAITSPARSST